MAELAVKAHARAAETDDPEERDRFEEAAAAYEGNAIPPSGAPLPDPREE